jgi:hypothetical protein
MNLNRFGKKNAQLNQLLEQSAHWQRLSACLKQELPVSIRTHFNVACVRDGCVVVIAHNSMAASRLRMVLPALLPQLQQIDATIETVKVKVQPVDTKPEAVKRASLSPAARSALAHSAQALSHHPELAAALRRLSEKNS